jgi:hypothetical protein
MRAIVLSADLLVPFAMYTSFTYPDYHRTSAPSPSPQLATSLPTPTPKDLTQPLPYRDQPTDHPNHRRPHHVDNTSAKTVRPGHLKIYGPFPSYPSFSYPELSVTYLPALLAPLSSGCWFESANGRGRGDADAAGGTKHWPWESGELVPARDEPHTQLSPNSTGHVHEHAATWWGLPAARDPRKY